MQTILAPKGRRQRQSKIIGVQKWKQMSQYNIEMYILTFQVLSIFSANFFCPGFGTFWGQIPGYFWTWTDIIQISRFSWFPGSAGNPEYRLYELTYHIPSKLAPLSNNRLPLFEKYINIKLINRSWENVILNFPTKSRTQPEIKAKSRPYNHYGRCDKLL